MYVFLKTLCYLFLFYYLLVQIILKLVLHVSISSQPACHKEFSLFRIIFEYLSHFLDIHTVSAAAKRYLYPQPRPSIEGRTCNCRGAIRNLGSISTFELQFSE